MVPITVEVTVNAPIERVWDCLNDPEHIKGWAFAQDDWEAPFASNDLRVGGTLTITMSAKDKSASFDMVGVYTAVEQNKLIEYTMEDGRKVKVELTETPEGVHVTETFDPENENSQDLQRSGWQAILNNFKKYTESNL